MCVSVSVYGCHGVFVCVSVCRREGVSVYVCRVELVGQVGKALDCNLHVAGSSPHQPTQQ